MQIAMTTPLESLHACWCTTTGQDLHYKATERIWYEMSKLDFTDDDLLIVLKDVLYYNRTHSSCPMKIQVHKLCSDLEVFASLLASAKAKARNKIKPTPPRDEVLSAWRGVKPEGNGNCHKLSDLIHLPKP